MSVIFCASPNIHTDKFIVIVIRLVREWASNPSFINLYIFGLSKAETGAKTVPRVPKLGYFDGRVPKLSSRVTLATSGADVVCPNLKSLSWFGTDCTGKINFFLEYSAVIRNFYLNNLYITWEGENTCLRCKFCCFKQVAK